MTGMLSNKRNIGPALASTPHKRPKLEVKLFWETHFNFSISQTKLSPDEVFLFYCQTNPNTIEDPSVFHRETTSAGVKCRKRKSKTLAYFADPISSLACSQANLLVKYVTPTEDTEPSGSGTPQNRKQPPQSPPNNQRISLSGPSSLPAEPNQRQTPTETEQMPDRENQPTPNLLNPSSESSDGVAIVNMSSNKNILNFWTTHYVYQRSKVQHKILIPDVFALFRSLEPEYSGSITQFHAIATRLGVQTQRKYKDINTGSYYATPTSNEAKSFHNLSTLVKLPTSNKCNFHLLNINGLISEAKKEKRSHLASLIVSETKSKILALTETHLNSGHLDKEVTRFFPDFNLFRSDRDTKYSEDDGKALSKGGGCALLLSRCIIASEKVKFSNGVCELLIVECAGISMDFIVVYNPPKPNFKLAKFKDIIQRIESYIENREDTGFKKNITLCGDFNFPPKVVKWVVTDDCVFPDPLDGDTDQKAAFQLFQDLMDKFSLDQIVNKPTRTNHITDTHNMLDLVLTDCSYEYNACTSVYYNDLSDHNLVSFKLDTLAVQSTSASEDSNTIPELLTYNIKAANKPAMHQALSTICPISFYMNSDSITTANDLLIKKLVRAIKIAKVPKFSNKSKLNPAEKKVKEIQDKMSTINKQLSEPKLRSSHRDDRQTALATLNEELKTALQEQLAKEEQEAVTNLKADPSCFFRYANSYKNSKDSIGPLKDRDDQYVSEPLGMANILASQFISVFTKPKDDLSSLNLRDYDFTEINDIPFSSEDIISAINELSASSAPGPDNITAFFYKEYADQLAPIIYQIWRSSLDHGKLPEGTARAIITPIYKGGVRSEPVNYRPVALTNHLTKIFERVVKKAIVMHLEENDVMNPTQHGFRKNRSTVSQLLAYMDSVLTKLEQGLEVDSIYLDFSKAFDKVDHGVLLAKMEKLKIKGKLLNWVRAFLTSREQVVRVEKRLSNPAKVTSGVPQGSVLGPLLFLILMLDINQETFIACMGSFADDTRLWHSISTLLVANELQEELNIVYGWADDNNMKFNQPKFEMMKFGDSDRVPEYKTPSGEPIPCKPLIKDLGIYVDDKLLFREHILTTAANGHKMAHWALRVFRARSTLMMKTLLKTVVLPHVEYGCIVWSPTVQSQINLLENVQRQFTSRFSVFLEHDSDLDMLVCNATYPERLEKLKIYSQERRRERFIIITTYKILIGILPNPGLSWSNNTRTGIRVEPSYCRTAPNWVKKARESSFFYQGPCLYNKLPKELRKEEHLLEPKKADVLRFKRSLDKQLQPIPDIPGTSENSLLKHSLHLQE